MTNHPPAGFAQHPGAKWSGPDLQEDFRCLDKAVDKPPILRYNETILR
jgi:hypothetical protein